MSESEEILSKRALIVIGIISLSIFVIGMALLALGYNKAFYVENYIVQFIFIIVTDLGPSWLTLYLIAILYFIYDKRFAKNLYSLFLFSAHINSLIKDIFHDPRPPTERGLSSPGYGFPSGHAQIALDYWGYIAYHFKDKLKHHLIPVILSIIIFLVAISRIIIGVHDLQDIIGGLLIGIAILIAFLYLEPIFSEKINSFNVLTKIILAIVISILLYIIATLLFPEPQYGINVYALNGGALLGLFVGYILECEYIKYEPSELTNKQKVINLIIGIGILTVYNIFIIGLIWIAMVNYFFIGGIDIRLFVIAAISTFMITFLIPLLFTKINRV